MGFKNGPCRKKSLIWQQKMLICADPGISVGGGVGGDPGPTERESTDNVVLFTERIQWLFQ